MVTARKRQTRSFYRVACMLTDQVGDAVYIRSQANGFYKVARADVSLHSKIPAIGIIVQKFGFTDAVVQIEGELKDVYSGLTPGRTYFVGDDGRPSLTPPEPDMGGRAYVQAIGVALDISVLLVKPAESVLVRVG